MPCRILYYSRTSPNLYIGDRQRRDFADPQTRLEHQLYQRIVALSEPIARLTGSPQQHMNLGFDQSDRAVTSHHPDRLKLVCDISFDELLTTGPRTKPPQRFKPSIDGRRFETFGRDEMLAIIDQVTLGEPVESKFVPSRLR